ncbi:MAG TPA: ATP-binding protein [Pyrinomonadaceae bacterium]|nr:ATP-binding protein [Pyrinomonadaceae bacterium]
MKLLTLSNDAASRDGPFVASAKTFSRIAGFFAVLVGALVLLGWLFDIEELKSVYAGITMKANAALCFLLAGLSLWTTGVVDRKLVVRLRQVCAGVVTLLGLMTLSQHLFGWNLGIDQLLFNEPPGAVATTSPGRMGPFASICFTLIGADLLLLHARRAVSLAQVLAISVCLLALLPIIGYAYGAQSLYGIARYTGIALHTAVTLFALGLGLLGMCAEKGLLTVISDERPGGQMARRLLLAAVSVPFLLGWLRLLGQRAGYYDLGFGAAVLVLSIIILFSVIIWLSTARLSHTEQQRLAAESIVREKEEGLRQQAALIELSYEPIFIWDLDKGIIEWNKGCEQLYGYTREDAVGQSNHQLLRTVFPTSLNDQLQSLTRDGYWSGELRHRTRDGREVIVESRQQLIESDGKRLVLETNHDITERKRAEAEREQLLEREQSLRAEAELSNRMKDEFLATVSHELRTPLTSILGWAAMLRRGALDGSTAKRALATIERNARAQAQLVEDLLDVSRVISGKLRLDVKPTDLMLVIKSALDSVRPAADAKGIQLRLVLYTAASQIQADAARLQQVVWNLLSNAIKFTPHGGQVEVRLERTPSDSRIIVSDTGEGITPEFLPHVFDRFQQADGTTTRRHGGLGLGLAIVRHLVEMHGGSVEAASEGLGRGATFIVKLPLVAASADVVSQGLELESEAHAEAFDGKHEADLRGVRVLAVDDEPDTRDMLRVVLERYGAQVMAVGSASDALEAMPAWRPDVLVSDIGMPGEDGYSLIEKVRKLETVQGSHTPAVALTGYVRVEERARALAAGYQMFVPKPVEAGELAAVIANLVGRDGNSG